MPLKQNLVTTKAGDLLPVFNELTRVFLYNNMQYLSLNSNFR